MEQKQIKITRASGWYKQLLGTTFTVIAESLSNYIVLTSGDIEFWVDKNDCVVVEQTKKLPIKVKLIPNYDGDTVDFPVKLPQGDWIDMRVLDVKQVWCCNTVIDNKSKEFDIPVLSRSNPVVPLHWKKGIFEGKEVNYIFFAKHTFLMLDLATAIEMPEGYEAYVIPRSSLFKNTGLIQTNSFGLIDNSYNSETDIWKMPVYSLEDGFIIQNERICQFRLQKIQPELSLDKVESLNSPSRGGFGEGTKLIK